MSFLQRDLLGQAATELQSDQEVKQNPYLRGWVALDRAAARIGRRFKDEPLVEAAIRLSIGASYVTVEAKLLPIGEGIWLARRCETM